MILPIYILLGAKGKKAFILSCVQRACFAKNKAEHIKTQGFSKSQQHQEYIWKKRSWSSLSVWQVLMEKSVINQQIHTCTLGPIAVKDLHSISTLRGWAPVSAWAHVGTAMEKGRHRNAEVKYTAKIIFLHNIKSAQHKILLAYPGPPKSCSD